MHLPRFSKLWLMVEQDCVFESVGSYGVLIAHIGVVSDNVGGCASTICVFMMYL